MCPRTRGHNKGTASGWPRSRSCTLQNHSHHLALSLALGVRDRLRVGLERGAGIGMAQELLHHLYVLPFCLKQRRERMAEGVPANALGDAGTACCGAYVPSEEAVRPIGLSPTHPGTGKDPVFRLL